MHYYLSFTFRLLKFFMIIDDSFSQLTTRLIVHDSYGRIILSWNIMRFLTTALSLVKLRITYTGAGSNVDESLL